MDTTFPFSHHPCWASSRDDLWERIHLPVAPKCNVKCFFCDHCHGSSSDGFKPGSSSLIMTPNEAIETLTKELSRRPRLRIVGISGPGDPLENPESFEVMQHVHEMYPDLRLCLCTNGILLADRLSDLVRLDIKAISVSISTVSPVTAERIYEWARVDGELLIGNEMGNAVVEKQVEGIAKVVEAGIKVKANTILIPSINENEMEELSGYLAMLGAHLQNIVPLVPWAKMRSFQAPTSRMLTKARKIGSMYLRQFYHCHQCRSDVVGVPGNDSILARL